MYDRNAQQDHWSEQPPRFSVSFRWGFHRSFVSAAVPVGGFRSVRSFGKEMTPIHHPPDVILRAYAALLNQVFLFLRGRSHSRDGINKDEIHDLADALHNISGIITDYGTWTDDQQYTEFNLRPYDRKWAKSGLDLEAILDEKIKEFSKE